MFAVTFFSFPFQFKMVNVRENKVNLVTFFAIFFVSLILITIGTVTFFVFYEEKSHLEPPVARQLFKLSIIHFNDFHARFEEVNEWGNQCNAQQDSLCIGGVARMSTIVKQLIRKNENTTIVLDAGDSFQGTSWYTVFRYNVTSRFMNFFPIDATVIGNHEFAHAVEGLVPYIKSLKSPVVIANMDDRIEPTMQDLTRKSITIEREGRKIGIIGAIYREVSTNSITGKLKFTDEVVAIRNEATKLRQKGANIIIVLSHSGLAKDREIAAETGDFVDVIVGGHSHTFLYSAGNDDQIPGVIQPADEYPIVAVPRSGKNRKVLIVQALAFTKFIGHLSVYFDEDGHVKYYEGNPIYNSANIEKDAEIENELKRWRGELEQITAEVIGVSDVDMLHDADKCRIGECLLGNLVNDAFLSQTRISFPSMRIEASIVHAGGMRGSIRRGDITFGDILTLFPFTNTVDVVELEGHVLIDMFEHSISRSWYEDRFVGANMLQVSGLQLTFNVTKPVGERLQTIRIRTFESELYEDVERQRVYMLTMPSFLSQFGGDGFTMIPAMRRSHHVGPLDVDLINNFVASKNVVTSTIKDRIKILI